MVGAKFKHVEKNAHHLLSKKTTSELILGGGVLIMDIKLLKDQTLVLPDIHRSKKGSKVNLHANLIENCMPLNVEMSKTFMHKII